MNNENILLKNALIYEDGHKRRTQHILKVLSLTSYLAECEKLSDKDTIIIKASAILHDIAIKKCKEKYNEAGQILQQKEAPDIVFSMLSKADYDPSFKDEILSLVLSHHDYKNIKSFNQQLLIEADLLTNLLEDPEFNIDKKTLLTIFKSECGIELLNTFFK